MVGGVGYHAGRGLEAAGSDEDLGGGRALEAERMTTEVMAEATRERRIQLCLNTNIIVCRSIRVIDLYCCGMGID